MSVLSPEMRPNSFATAQLKSGLMLKKTNKKNRIKCSLRCLSHYRLLFIVNSSLALFPIIS